MLPQVLQNALNEQINYELRSSYIYLGMAAYCRQAHLHGFAKWLEVQSQEEYGHGMKLYRCLVAHNCKIDLRELPTPKREFASVLEVFQEALQHEKTVTQRIDTLYELALREKAYAAVVELQWFVSEQVEEEQTFGRIVGQLQVVKDDPVALLDLDRHMGSRGGE